MSKVDECKKSDPDSFPICVSPGRTREQLALSSKVYKLNEQAKPGEKFQLEKQCRCVDVQEE